MKRFDRIVTGLGVGATAGLALWLASASTETPRPVTEAGSPAAATRAPLDSRRATPPFGLPPGAPSTGRTAGCATQEGQTFTYAVRVSTERRLDPTAAGLPAHVPYVAENTTEATLEARVLSSATVDRPATWVARLRDVRSTTAGEAERLTTPFLLRVAEDCGFEGYARHRGARREFAQRQQAFVYELHFRWPEGVEAGPTTGSAATGENATGSYRARIGYVDHEDGGLLQRRILEYTTQWDERSDARPGTSLLTVRVGDGSFFASMVGVDETIGTNGRARVSIEASTEATRRDALAGVPTDESEYVWEDLLPLKLESRVPRAITEADRERQAAVAHLTLEESVERMIDRVEGDVGIADTWPELTDYLEARPEQTVPLVHMLQDDEIPETARPALYMALSRARTQEARQVLFAIAQDGAAPVIERTRAMFAMVDRDDVGLDVANYMQSVAMTDSGGDAGSETLARESLLALGALAGLQHDDAIEDVAMEAVMYRLEAAHDGPALTSAFGAIGNIGKSRHLPRVRPFTSAPDPGVREAATYALRRMRPAEAGPFVAEWLARETHPLVRRRLYQTLVRQSADSAAPQPDAVLALAIADLQAQPESLMLRKALIRIVGGGVARSEAARRALIAQIPIEMTAGSGLYSEVVGFLSPEDIREGLALRRASR